MKTWLIPIVSCLILGGVLLAAESPGSKEVLDKGRDLEKSGKIDEALAVYRNALASTPELEIYKRTVTLLGRKRDYPEASRLLEEALKRFPDDTSLLNLRGMVYQKLGAMENARESWNKVLKLDPKNQFASEQLGKLPSPASGTGTKVSPSDQNTKSPSLPKVPEPSGDPSKPLTKEEQIALAKKNFKALMELDKWDLDAMIPLYWEIIRRCPETEQAPESCWRLSNLYLLGKTPPDLDATCEVLEHLVKFYPKHVVTVEGRKRLINTYKKTSNHQRVAELTDEMIKSGTALTPKEKCALLLQYGDALVGLDQKTQAKQIFEQIVAEGQVNFPSVTVAKARLKGL